MTTTLVSFGGNGYIGKAFTRTWLERHPDTTIYVVSRSGKGALEDPRVTSLAVDITAEDASSQLSELLPQHIDIICNFVGRPEKDPAQFEKINWVPARNMLSLAHSHGARTMGFIGGTLGPRPFIEGKAAIATMLKESGIPTAVVAPTVVWGGGRSDALSTMVPLLRLFGTVMPNLKPVHVDTVVAELADKIEASTH